VEVVPFNVFEADPAADWFDSADGCHAFVMGGSGSVSVHDEVVDTWRSASSRFFERSLTDDFPGFCICFGHQLLAQHLGAEVVRDADRREAGTVYIEVVGEDPLFDERAPRFSAHQGHSDHVVAAPDGTTLLARNESSPVQALRVDGTNTYSTQFHPDFLATEARQRYAEIFGTGDDSQVAMAKFDPERDEDTMTLLSQWWDAL
jgi:GMP synthase (glutamine-hydrolysing)